MDQVEGPVGGTLLEALIEGPLSSAELIAALVIKSKTGDFKRSIRELLGREMVEFLNSLSSECQISAKNEYGHLPRTNSGTFT